MYRTGIQQAWFFILWLLLLTLEKTWGLPLFSLTFVALQLTTLPLHIRIPLWILMSLVLASMYLLPLSVSALVTFTLVSLLEVERLPYKYKSKLFWVVVVGMNMIFALITIKEVQLLWIFWHLFLAAALFLFLKYWFERREYSRVTTRARVITWQRK